MGRRLLLRVERLPLVDLVGGRVVVVEEAVPVCTDSCPGTGEDEDNGRPIGETEEA